MIWTGRDGSEDHQMPTVKSRWSYLIKMTILTKHTDYIAALESVFSSICDLVVCFVGGSTMEPDNLYWPGWWLHHGASKFRPTCSIAAAQTVNHLERRPSTDKKMAHDVA